MLRHVIFCPLQVYLERAEQLVAQASAGDLSQRQLFLSTEDPATVEFFAAQQPRWDVQYTDVPRKPDR
jgi:hypothetical protein